MEQRYVLTLALTNLFVLVFTLNPLLGQAQQTFTGSNSSWLMTDTFECAGVCQITWTTEYEDPYLADFYVKINQLGDKDFGESFRGLSGTTLLYAEGTFYFVVDPSEIIWWEITVEEVPLPEPSTHFAGRGSITTGIFTCVEHCVLTWTTEYEDLDYASFNAYIYPLGGVHYYEKVWGLSGTTHLYAEGTFYIKVGTKAWWEIIVEEVPIIEMEPSTSFSGKCGVLTTGIFTCVEHCTITWTTEYDKRLDPTGAEVSFNVRIRQLGEGDFDERIYGLNGTTHLYIEGTFYFMVLDAWKLTTWEITVEEVPLSSMEPSMSFTGVDDRLTTGIFTCAGHCVLNWTTEYEDPTQAGFDVEIYQPGEEDPYDNIEELRGTTHLYAEGPFYFKIRAEGITAWKITVEEMPLEPSTSFSGVGGSFTTGIFMCAEHCIITWTTEFEDPYLTHYDFGAGIYQLGEEELSVDSFRGLSGTTHLYAKGTFYFMIHSRGITVWEITVEEMPLPESSTSFAGEYPAVEGFHLNSFNTGIFTCAEHCTITWTTEPEDHGAEFSFMVYKLGTDSYYGPIYGLSGTTDFTDFNTDGTFYFKVESAGAGITAWKITVEEVPTTTTPETTPKTPTIPEIQGKSLLWLFSGMLVAVVVARQKRRKQWI